MDQLPGVLLYEIAKFGEISDLLILECFSTSLRAKLMASKSAFAALLRKTLGDKTMEDQSAFEDFKKLAKECTNEKRGHLLPWFNTNPSKLVLFDVNTQQIVKNQKIIGLETFTSEILEIDWAFITPTTLIALGVDSDLSKVFSIDINTFNAKRIGDLCEPKYQIANCVHRRRLYAFGGETVIGKTNSSEVLMDEEWTQLPECPMPIRFGYAEPFHQNIYIACFDKTEIVKFSTISQSYCTINHKEGAFYHKYLVPIKDCLYIWAPSGTSLISKDDQLKRTYAKACYPAGDCRGTFAVSEDIPYKVYFMNFQGDVKMLDTMNLETEYDYSKEIALTLLIPQEDNS